jgi:hypothetical protein
MQDRQDNSNQGTITKEPDPFAEAAALRAIVEGVKAKTGEQSFPSQEVVRQEHSKEIRSPVSMCF